MKVRNYHNNKYSVQSHNNDLHLVIENHSSRELGAFPTLTEALNFISKHHSVGFEGCTPPFLYTSFKVPQYEDV